MALQRRAGGEQADHVARRGLDGNPVTDPVHITGDIAPDAAAGDDLIGPAGKEILDDAASARQQAVGMASLRHAFSRHVLGWKTIALQDRDLVEEIRKRSRCQQAAHAGADHNCMLADPAHGVSHPHPFGEFR